MQSIYTNSGKERPISLLAEFESICFISVMFMNKRIGLCLSYNSRNNSHSGDVPTLCRPWIHGNVTSVFLLWSVQKYFYDPGLYLFMLLFILLQFIRYLPSWRMGCVLDRLTRFIKGICFNLCHWSEVLTVAGLPQGWCILALSLQPRGKADCW